MTGNSNAKSGGGAEEKEYSITHSPSYLPIQSTAKAGEFVRFSFGEPSGGHSLTTESGLSVPMESEWPDWYFVMPAENVTLKFS